MTLPEQATVERMARAFYRTVWPMLDWDKNTVKWEREEFIEAMRAALATLPAQSWPADAREKIVAIIDPRYSADDCAKYGGPNSSPRSNVNIALAKADAILALVPQSWPAGWKLVPEMPTQEMADAGARAMAEGPQDGFAPPFLYPKTCYRAMLDAAPPPEVKESGAADNKKAPQPKPGR